jgi:hypothetical protein
MALKVNDKIYKRKIKKLERYIARRLPEETLNEFKENTPIDRGFARRNTKIKNKSKRGFTIIGDYNYSGVIDRGKYPNPPANGTGKTRGGYSTQSPKGMTKPTMDMIRKKIKKFIGRL